MPTEFGACVLRSQIPRRYRTLKRKVIWRQQPARHAAIGIGARLWVRCIQQFKPVIAAGLYQGFVHILADGISGGHIIKLPKIFFDVEKLTAAVLIMDVAIVPLADRGRPEKEGGDGTARDICAGNLIT